MQTTYLLSYVLFSSGNAHIFKQPNLSFFSNFIFFNASIPLFASPLISPMNLGLQQFFCASCTYSNGNTRSPDEIKLSSHVEGNSSNIWLSLSDCFLLCVKYQCMPSN